MNSVRNIGGSLRGQGLPSWVDLVIYAGIVLSILAGMTYLLMGQPPGPQMAASAANGARTTKAVAQLFSKEMLVAFVLLGLIGLKLLDWLLSHMGKAVGAIILTFVLNLLTTNLKVCANYLLRPLGGHVAVSAQVMGVNLTELPVVALTTGAGLLLLGIGANLVVHGSIRGRR